MIDDKEIVKVGIADMNVVKAPQVIRTTGLGSCVGLILYDETKKVAGLLHVLLPSSNSGKSGTFKLAKFADTGVSALIDLLKSQGVHPSRLKAKMAGGAQMFQLGSKDTMRIGPRNIEAVKKELDRLSIPLISEDIGGNKGRTIEFDPITSLLHIRTVNSGTRDI